MDYMYVVWGYAKLIAWRETAMAPGYHTISCTWDHKRNKKNPVEHRGNLWYWLRLYLFNFAKLA